MTRVTRPTAITALLDTILPGTETRRLRHFPLDTDMTASGAVPTFHAAAGITWMRIPESIPMEQTADKLKDAIRAGDVRVKGP
jgi:hypothetical protein